MKTTKKKHFLPSKQQQKLFQRQIYQKSNHAFTKTKETQESINQKIPKKKFLATLSSRKTPPEIVSKTKIPKIQPYIHKNPKIPRKHQEKNTKKILKLKNFYQTSSPSEVKEKNNQKLSKKN